MTDQAVTEADRHPLDLVAEEFAERCRAGDRPSVSDFVRLHPQWAAELRELLPPIALMEKLKRRNTSGGSSDARAASAPAPALERLGDFRIVREVGRGGMGIVYEAEQESLGRRVALKVLSRASLLDPQRLARFEREAKAAAGLHHTNIVPVFGVGEQEGLHYYVMQFIEGRPLSDVLHELSGAGKATLLEVAGAQVSAHPPLDATADMTVPARQAGGPNAAAAHRSPAAPPAPAPSVGRRYWRWVADVGRQVAQALQYAHHQGVLHRDVKPANLLLDPGGMVWITDFGLAKLGTFSEVTRTGDVVGTLQYLAPEGLKSQADERSDVYGLGISLYELLTRRPAFNGQSPAALMRQVAEGEPLRPRRIDPQIPRDLETIVLKAIARDPGARYARAGELAEDLDNFLHDRPIIARRASMGERAWRWCRRNRAVSILGSAAAACAIVAIVVGWSAYGTTRRALVGEREARIAESARRAEADMARRAADAARGRADANVALSLQGFEDIFNTLAPQGEMAPPGPWTAAEPPPRQPGANGQDAAVLQSILNFYDKFTRENATSESLQAEAAKAYRRVGDAYLRLGKTAEADAAHRRCAKLYEELVNAAPTNADYRLGLVDAAAWVGLSSEKLSADDAALIRHASGVADALVRDYPQDQDYAGAVARAFFREGTMLRASGQLPRAEAQLRRAIQLWNDNDPPPPPPADQGGGGPRPPPPPPSPSAAERPIALAALAEVYVDEKKPDQAKELIQSAMKELQDGARGPRGPGGGGGVGGGPGGPGRERALASAYAAVARAAERAGDTATVERANAQAADLRTQRRPDRPPEDGPEGPDRPPPPDGPPRDGRPGDGRPGGGPRDRPPPRDRP